jgi:hypothetical protein
MAKQIGRDRKAAGMSRNLLVNLRSAGSSGNVALKVPVWPVAATEPKRRSRPRKAASEDAGSFVDPATD